MGYLLTAHSSVVKAWLAERVTADTSAAEIGVLFSLSMREVFEQAKRVLGEVTVRAIFDQVIDRCAHRHPFLERPAFAWQAPLDDGTTSEVGRDELMATTFEVLVELLDVLGALTANELSPRIEAGLASIRASKVAVRRRKHRASKPT